MGDRLPWRCRWFGHRYVFALGDDGSRTVLVACYRCAHIKQFTTDSPEADSHILTDWIGKW